MVDCGAFVGEEVVEDVEEGAEAGAEYWGYAEECQEKEGHGLLHLKQKFVS